MMMIAVIMMIMMIMMMTASGGQKTRGDELGGDDKSVEMIEMNSFGRGLAGEFVVVRLASRSQLYFFPRPSSW